MRTREEIEYEAEAMRGHSTMFNPNGAPTFVSNPPTVQELILEVLLDQRNLMEEINCKLDEIKRDGQEEVKASTPIVPEKEIEQIKASNKGKNSGKGKANNKK